MEDPSVAPFVLMIPLSMTDRVRCSRMNPFFSCPAFPFENPNASHLVRDEVTGDWVIIAPGRRYRPMTETAMPKTDDDPFSPQSIKNETVLATYGKGKNTITALENKYPVFHHDVGLIGRQELLAEGREIQSFSEFSVSQVSAVFEAYAARAKVFRKDPKLKFMVVFKNEGHDSGASQPHPHSQLFGLPFVPDRLKQMAALRAREQKRSRRTLHQIVLEQATSARTIFQDKYAIAFANPSGRFAYEVRILTKRRIDNITQAIPDELRSIAKMVHALFPLIRERKMGFNYFFHDVFEDTHEPFEIRFAPRSNVWGGFELDAGIVVNSVPAECAAEEYRKAGKAA